MEPEREVRTKIPERVIRGDKDELPERAGVTDNWTKRTSNVRTQATLLGLAELDCRGAEQSLGAGDRAQPVTEAWARQTLETEPGQLRRARAKDEPRPPGQGARRRTHHTAGVRATCVVTTRKNF